MTAESKGYRALPAEIRHPKLAKRVTDDDFKQRAKTKLEDGGSVYPGHIGTEIWYCDPGYIVRVKMEGHPDELIESISTFTPTFGMDAFDGHLAQDAEEWVLLQALGRPSTRLEVFGDAEVIGIHDYLKRRNTPFSVPQDTNAPQSPKKWWEFWK